MSGEHSYQFLSGFLLTTIATRSEIIVTSRKPPGNFWVDPRVRFISLDFLESPDVLIEKLRKICQHVTHAFFTSYIHSSDFVDTEDSNCALFRNFLEAVDTVCPNLQRVSLQTGGKVSSHFRFVTVWSYFCLFKTWSEMS